MMRKGIAITILSGLIFLIACHDPPADTSKATTGEAAHVASPAVAQGQKYLITPQNSKIEFIGSKVTGKQNGSFGDFSGQVDYAGSPENSRVSITIKIESINTDAPDLTKHLKTADFFDAAKYPEATFVSTAIKPGGDKGATHTVTGNLTMHGVTKSVTFPASLHITAEAADVDAEFAINRKDFGIVYPGKPDDLIKDEVLIKLSLRAKKAS